jgi:hypothetical protein
MAQVAAMDRVFSAAGGAGRSVLACRSRRWKCDRYCSRCNRNATSFYTAFIRKNAAEGSCMLWVDNKACGNLPTLKRRVSKREDFFEFIFPGRGALSPNVNGEIDRADEDSAPRRTCAPAKRVADSGRP